MNDNWWAATWCDDDPLRYGHDDDVDDADGDEDDDELHKSWLFPTAGWSSCDEWEVGLGPLFSTYREKGNRGKWQGSLFYI